MTFDDFPHWSAIFLKRDRPGNGIDRGTPGGHRVRIPRTRTLPRQRVTPYSVVHFLHLPFQLPLMFRNDTLFTNSLR